MYSRRSWQHCHQLSSNTRYLCTNMKFGPLLIPFPFSGHTDSVVSVAFSPDGSLLLSESNGLVKQFAADGTLVEILGSANVQSGCKNSSIGLSTDGATLYYLDINRGRVLVLEKKS